MTVAQWTTPSPLPRERCGTCKFWNRDTRVDDPGDSEAGFGDCRRRPPVFIERMLVLPRPNYGEAVDMDADTTTKVTASNFPCTTASDWCGEYEPTTGWPVI